MIQGYKMRSRTTASAVSRRVRVLSIAGLVGVSLFGMVSCDTVADISFSERRFQEVRPAGFTSPAGMCEGTDGDLAMRFVLMANDNTTIKPGEAVDTRDVNLTADSLSFSNANVFSLPDQHCEDAQQGMCPSTFICAVGSESMASSFQRCTKSTEVTVKSAPQFVADTSSDQLFGIAMTNAGSLRGWLPEGIGSLYPVDDEGQTTGSRDEGPDNARATDGQKYRHSALSTMVDNWVEAARNAQRTGVTTRFGLWSYAGSLTQVEPMLGAESYWTNSPAQATSAVSTFSNSDPARTRSSVYESVEEILDQGYADAAYDGMDKTLVLFVDGPDGLRDSPDGVIDKAKQYGVKIFVVHLDSRINAERLRDDYRYYENQSGCDSDDQCLNFEECRLPERYRVQQNGTNVDYPQDLEAKYCLPTRDENGRVGPIHDYSQIACETQGSYIYVPAASAIQSRMAWLPHVMDGLWEVTTSVTDASRGSLEAGEAFKLQSTFRVEVSGESHTYSFSQLGDQTASFNDDDAADTRGVFFMAQ